MEDEAPEGTSELQWQIQKRCNKENDWLARLAALGWGFLETFFLDIIDITLHGRMCIYIYNANANDGFARILYIYTCLGGVVV